MLTFTSKNCTQHQVEKCRNNCPQTIWHPLKYNSPFEQKRTISTCGYTASAPAASPRPPQPPPRLMLFTGCSPIESHLFAPSAIPSDTSVIRADVWFRHKSPVNCPSAETTPQLDFVPPFPQAFDPPRSFIGEPIFREPSLIHGIEFRKNRPFPRGDVFAGSRNDFLNS